MQKTSDFEIFRHKIYIDTHVIQLNYKDDFSMFKVFAREWDNTR